MNIKITTRKQQQSEEQQRHLVHNGVLAWRTTYIYQKHLLHQGYDDKYIWNEYPV